jgi:phage shock protein A
MAAKVDQMEAEAAAVKELEDVSTSGSLEKRFAELEKSAPAADQMLLELKAKMKALPDSPASGS